MAKEKNSIEFHPKITSKKYTATRIGNLLLFYFVFYSILGGLFAGMMAVFYQTIDNDRPKWMLDDSLIGSNPALGLRPTDFFGESFISYKRGDNESIKYWISHLNEFLSPYIKERRSVNVENCEFKQFPTFGKVCDFQLNEFLMPQECSQENGYGFGADHGGPCIFLKLNKIYGWYPQVFNGSESLPDMPDYLVSHIKNYHKKCPLERGLVWVVCDGRTPLDSENIGPIVYYPVQGFQSKYFPYLNIEGYLSPLVVVHFQNPQSGIVINVECKAWARNIHHDGRSRGGIVHFKLKVD